MKKIIFEVKGKKWTTEAKIIAWFAKYFETYKIPLDQLNNPPKGMTFDEVDGQLFIAINE